MWDECTSAHVHHVGGEAINDRKRFLQHSSERISACHRHTYHKAGLRFRTRHAGAAVGFVSVGRRLGSDCVLLIVVGFCSIVVQESL
jgi:hypothetical protein